MHRAPAEQKIWKTGLTFLFLTSTGIYIFNKMRWEAIVHFVDICVQQNTTPKQKKESHEPTKKRGWCAMVICSNPTAGANRFTEL